jgi:hypothetical protein
VRRAPARRWLGVSRCPQAMLMTAQSPAVHLGIEFDYALAIAEQIDV